MKVMLGGGNGTSRSVMEVLQRNGWGRLMVERMLPPYPGEPWGIDNGAYGLYLKGKQIDLKWYRDRAYQAAEIGGCQIAVLPDIVAGGEKSLEMSMEELENLPEELPWYLVLQDGFEFQPLWSKVCDAAEDPRIHGLFLGGTNRFKLTAASWRHTANMLGKRLHYGRAGTPFKVQHAIRTGVDSLDSSFPLWTKERMRIFEMAVNGTLPQQQLDLDLGGPPKKIFLASPHRKEK